jgi:glycosyltransferase involved in cell wall biosynthesis
VGPLRELKSRLRVGVPAPLLELAPVGGHGKVWHRVLTALAASVELIPLAPDGRRRGRLPRAAPEVVLASGHDELPPVSVPLVVQVHEAGWFDPQLRDILQPSFLDQIAPRTERALRLASEVITPSEAARRELISAYGLDPGLVHAVPHGVDDGFRPDLSGGSALVARVLGGREAPYVLYAATLHPRKNLVVVREAMAALAGEGFPHALAIAGQPAPDRPDSSALERAAAAELAGAPHRVAFLGQPSDADLAALMAGAAAFCLPSLYEGFGLTALEAMACGAPVVVSDRGALPEVVGEAGLVVEPTAAATAGALRELLTDRGRAQRLGAQAAIRARGFSWARTAAGWLAVLRDAAAQPYTRPR